MRPDSRPKSQAAVGILTFEDGQDRERVDRVATEEPMEMRALARGISQTIAVTMRTPGADFELTAGFLHTEGLIGQRQDIVAMKYCIDSTFDAVQRYNIVSAELRPGLQLSLPQLERHFFTSSACGVCGKAGLEALRGRSVGPPARGPQVAPELISTLTEKLRKAQGVFAATGGLHAAGLFDAAGVTLAVREDVGRHNAVDKAVGWALLNDRLPLRETILVVSGRASFEIVQKALVAGIPIVCAVSAPSSLAVSLADEFSMTLIGFIRGSRFNVYAGRQRITPAGKSANPWAAGTQA
ncbi:MAG: formate dehydrogenase accessory sulfurtransferase FdhD [Candidatus Eremiobacteraeota bacterium]|nr:formate dehydrogenase accessory sulfurtransferase FdhD [Candidatus Eremiobacteraeota bacterium]MBC5827797.1 formate dehydrogenase accessory sulfurtransferase FdhD [Candidatus Eremiobacteraeota bacterium]